MHKIHQKRYAAGKAIRPIASETGECGPVGIGVGSVDGSAVGVQLKYYGYP